MQQAIGLIRALGFVAWADQRIAPEEREMLVMVMDALDIPEARRRELCEALRAGPPALEDVRAAFSDDIERRFAIAQAIMLAQADGHLSDQEKMRIAELAGALGVNDDELSLIFEAVALTDELMPTPPLEP